MSNTISEALALIKAENLKPLDIFRLGDLLKDPMVAEAIKEEVKEAVTGEYKNRERDSKGFDKTREKMEADHKKAIDEKDDKIKKLITETSKTKSADLFTSKAKERKLTKEQIKFIDMKREKDFNPEDPEKLDSEVNKFIDTGLDDYKVQAEIFGKKVEDDTQKGGSEPREGDKERDASIIP